MEVCGSNFCPADADKGLNLLNLNQSDMREESAAGVAANFETSRTKIFLMASIYLACSLVAAALLALFLDPLTTDHDQVISWTDLQPKILFMKEETLSEPEQISGLKLLSATIRYSPHFAVIWDGGQNDKPLLVFTMCSLKRDSYTGFVQHQHHEQAHN